MLLCRGLQEQWQAMKKKEEDSRKKKNFGAGGARGFKSRSMVRRVRRQFRLTGGPILAAIICCSPREGRSYPPVCRESGKGQERRDRAQGRAVQ